MPRLLVLAALTLLACQTSAPVASAPPSDAGSSTSVRPTQSATPTIAPTTVVLPGTFSSVRFPTRPDLPFFGGHVLIDGRYSETAMSDGRDIVEHTLFDLSTSAVRRIDVPTGDLGGPVGLDDGRIAISLWARTSAGEAFDYLIEDAATKTRTAIDHSDAPGIFHGEAAPVQPEPGFVLSGQHVAFNHLFVQDGVLWVDLKVGSIGGAPNTVLRTRDPVRPIAVSETTLAYAVSSRANGEEQLHLYDLATHRDTLVLRGLFFFSAALDARRLLLYYAQPFDGTAGQVRLRDLATGAERELASGSCADPSLNERYAAITCGNGQARQTTITVFDLASGQPVDVARGSDPIGGVGLLSRTIYWTRLVGSPPTQSFQIEVLRY